MIYVPFMWLMAGRLVVVDILLVVWLLFCGFVFLGGMREKGIDGI